MNSDTVFDNFVRRRERLNLTLDEGRGQLDQWIDSHRDKSATLPELAFFEGLLADRRRVLEDLLKLDDSMLDHLVSILGKSRDGAPARSSATRGDSSLEDPASA